MVRKAAIKLGLLAFGLVVGLTMMAAIKPASTLLHPCHPGGSGGPGGPGGPGVGPPCPPTPEPGSETSVDASSLISFRLINQTEENITLWLGQPVEYVLNVPGNSESTFTVGRAVYDFQLAACGTQAGGFMDLTVHSFFIQPACQTEPLVKVWLDNPTGQNLAAILKGAQDYVIPLSAGQLRSITIPRGVYEVELMGCSRPSSSVFEAKAERSLILSCP